jgi:iron complex outermembrane receptor protein
MVYHSLRTSSALAALIVGLSSSPLMAQTATTTTGADPAANVPADAAQATVSPADQTAPAVGQATAAQSNGGLADIVVTATRRDSRLQTTPIAVSAIDSSLIQQASPRTIGDLAAFVPNFSASTITGFNAASFAIRGVGQTSIIVYFEPPVAVLVDDFVVPSVQTQLLDTFDVAQVEVLRGPQGTLFGKNTTGGAVTVRTKRPVMNKLGVEARFQYGSFNTRKIQGSINVPIIADKLALRVVGGYDRDDGYYHNGACYGPVTGFVPSKFQGVSGCLDGRRIGARNVKNARAKLLFEPTDRFHLLAQYEWLRDRSASVPSVNVNKEYKGSGVFLTDLLNTVRPNPNSSDPLDNAAITNRSGGLIDIERGQRISVDGYYLNADYDLDVGTLTSVTGYRSQRSRLPNSYAGVAPVAADGQSLSFFDAARDDDRKTFQQEVRFASKLQGPFQFVAGGFYQHETIDFCVAQYLGFLDLTAGPLPFGNWNDTPYILCNAQKGSSKAVFAEGTYKVTPTVTLTVGGRYTWEKKKWYGRQQAFVPTLGGGFDPSIVVKQALDASVFNYPAGVVTVDAKSNKPTYRASLGWQAAPTIFAYATYSRGFKGGGFNDQIGGFAPFGADLGAFRTAARATRPETADSYEAGVKSEFFNRRLRFNLTGFHVKYQDLQKQLNVPLIVNGQPNQVTLFVNAASAVVNGVELETSAVPTRGLTLRGVVGYQNAKYKTYDAPGAGYNLADAPLDRAPKWQWTLDGTYEVPVSGFKMTLNGNVNYTGRNLNTQDINDPLGNTFLNARTLVNASITVADEADRYYARLIGRNLTDKRYKTAEQNVAGLWQNAQYGPPRFYGIELGMKLGR